MLTTLCNLHVPENRRIKLEDVADEGPPAKLSNGLARTKAEPTSVPTAPHSPYPVSYIRVRKPLMATQLVSILQTGRDSAVLRL